MSPEALVLTDVHAGVMQITLNRPKVNAFNFELIAAVQEAFGQAAQDARVRSVLWTANGPIFSAGQDLEDLSRAEGSIREHLKRTYNPIIMQIRRLEKPVLAAINGTVTGAALGLVLACDLRIAANTARVLVGFGGIGLAPDSAVSLFLPLLAGLGRAAELTYTNAPISADQALAWGLVNRVVPVDALQSEAAAWAESLAAGPIKAMGLAKRAFNKAVLGDLEQVLDYEAHLQEIAARGSEHREGLSAFFEKRPPKYFPE